MLHLRLLVPAELTAGVLALLLDHPGCAHVSVVRQAAVQPSGDVVEADVVREIADELIEALTALGLSKTGAITAERLDMAESRSAERAQRLIPGNSGDSVVWQEVERRTGDDATLSGTFLAFLTIAVLLAAIGVVEDSAITLVGAMVVGPDFGPIAGISVGLVRRRPLLARRGGIALLVGFPFAMVVTGLLCWAAARAGLFSSHVLEFRPQTEFIYEPGVFSLVVALLAGAAGMLSMTSQKSAALVGVFISVTTVPAAGYVAVGTVLGAWNQVWGSAIQLLVNLIGMVVAGVVTLLVVRWLDRRREQGRSVRARRRTEIRRRRLTNQET